MDNVNFDIEKYLLGNSRSLKDYILLIRNNLLIFFTIALIIIAAAVAYAILAKNIYKSTVTLKISSQKQSVLAASSILPQISSMADDRFIANELEVVTNYDTRERYAKALIDSFNVVKDKSIFILLKDKDGKGINGHKNLKDLTELLKLKVSAEQKEGMDVVEISAESPSPYEAALIANTCADQYKEVNLETNRTQLTVIRKFLEKQSSEKLVELNNAEDTLKNFQEKGGIVALDAQSAALINQLSQLDVQRDAAKIDLMTSTEVLSQYKNELKKQDPQLVDYLENQTSQTYINVLQKQIAELQMNKDLALGNKNSRIDVTEKIKDYDQKITDLKQKLSGMINDIKAGAYASSPDQVKDLSQKLVEEEINNRALEIKLKELQSIISQYEIGFNRLPKKSIELAQYERKREALKQLYLLVDQKYQEAMINELSQPGNVFIIGIGRIPDLPAKPNRILIAVIGLIAGFFGGFGFLLIRDYFDDTVKNPGDIQDKNINILSWIPEFQMNGKEGTKKREFIILDKPDSSISESFRALRARLQFSRVDAGPLKTILVTSSAEQEGKTVVALNLAGSYAKSNKKTLLIDCDLRKPRVHKILGVNKNPGLVNYLFNQASLKDIIWRSDTMDNLFYINSGSIPPDPTEVIESKAMKNFLEEIKNTFEIVILDSAPIIAVIDSEILAKMVDGTILVVSADKTETKLMLDAVDLLKKDEVPFLGTVLNNFKYKNGYGYYYKYYYSYESDRTKGKKKGKEKIK
jgi:polysaccharide biosynthesis transport protein